MSSSDNLILGVRILIEVPQISGDYYVEYELSGDNWKEKAVKILPKYLGQTNVKIQTLHSFTPSHNLYTGQIIKPGNIWLDNYYFKLDDIL
jgi:hypothetical protein